MAKRDTWVQGRGSSGQRICLFVPWGKWNGLEDIQLGWYMFIYGRYISPMVLYLPGVTPGNVWYGLYMSSPKLIHWKPNSPMVGLGNRAFGKWLDHESFALDYCSYKRDPGGIPCLFYHVRIQREVGSLLYGREGFIELDHADTVILGFHLPEL